MTLPNKNYGLRYDTFYKKEDYNNAANIISYCFHLQIADFDKRIQKFESYPDDAMLGYFEDEILCAEMVLLPLEAYIAGKPLPMGGIACVASLPEIRKGGATSKLLNRSLEIMYERGIPISLLAPFSYDYYYKFGYENCFYRHEITMPALRLYRYKTEN